MQSNQFKTIGIIGKYDDTNISYPFDLVLKVLWKYGCHVLLDQQTIQASLHNKNCRVCDRKLLVSESDLIITIGGDGSFLAAGRSIIPYDKPIVGVNMGRLGFLTDISPKEITELLPKIICGDYKSEDRSIIQATVYRNNQLLKSHIAVNDVVVHKASVARMIELNVFLDEVFLSSYRADGLILSTSTGSTAYALSSGGPIVQPGISALTIVPISPHTLAQRPIVIDASTKVKIVIPPTQDNVLQLTVDGQEELELLALDIIYLTRYPKKLHIYHPRNYDVFSRFRQKLGWGSLLS